MRRLFACIVLFARLAHADPDDLVPRPIVLAPGQLELDLTVEMNLAPGQVAQPLSLAPDAWFGATARWTVGVVHSDPAVDRIEPGASFCFATGVTGCSRFYRGSGVDVRWSALAGELAVAPRARLLLRDVDPWKPAVTLGALVQWTHGRWAAWSDPYLQLGLANTDAGNRHALFVPIGVAMQPTCRWAIELRTGWDSDFAVIADGWYVPIWVGARARATAHVDVGAAVGFFSALGPQNNANQRAAFFTVGWRS